MRIRAVLSVVIMFILTVSLACAQTQRWEQFTGPYGGQLYRFLGLVVDDMTGDIYVGRMDGVLHSSNSGTHWGFDFTGRVLIYVLCFNANREIVVGTQNGVMFRDRSGGDWRSCPETEPFAIWSLVCQPGSGTLLAGCADGTLLRSTDHGRSWQIRSISRDVSCSVDHITCIDSNRLCAGTATEGAWISSDTGLTWDRTGSDVLPAGIRSLYVDDKRHLLFVSGSRSVCRSTDDGERWAVFPLPVDSQNKAAALCVAPGGRLFLGTDNGILSSDDLGESWTRRSMLLADTAIETLLYSEHGAYFLIATADGLFRSFTGEAPWELIGTPLEAPNDIHITSDGLLVVPTMFDMAITSDGGLSWHTTGLQRIFNVVSDNTQHILYAGGRTGMYRSTDRGVTWESIGDGLGSTAVYSVQVLPDGTVLAGTASQGGTGGVYASTDRGQHWEARVQGLDDRDIYWIERSPVDGTLYVSSIPGTIYRSADDGHSWWRYPISFDMYPTISVDIDGHVILGTARGGIHLSTDRGETWSRISTGVLDDATINWIETNNTGQIFAGCAGEGVFKTSDDGATWHRMNDGLRDSLVMCLTIDKDQYLYAGTFYGGVFRTAKPTVTGVDPRPLPTEVQIHSFPNPFSTSMLISVDSPFPAEVLTMTLHDATGRMVADLSPSVRANSLVRVTRSMLPSAGVYYIRLTTPGGTLTRAVICTE